MYRKLINRGPFPSEPLLTKYFWGREEEVMGTVYTMQVVYMDEAVNIFLYVIEKIQKKKTAFAYVVRFWQIQ